MKFHQVSVRLNDVRSLARIVVVRAHRLNSDIRVVLFNKDFRWKPFLQIAEDEDDQVTNPNIEAAPVRTRGGHCVPGPSHR
jgi:hypothetical protein